MATQKVSVQKSLMRTFSAKYIKQAADFDELLMSLLQARCPMPTLVHVCRRPSAHTMRHVGMSQSACLIMCCHSQLCFDHAAWLVASTSNVRGERASGQKECVQGLLRERLHYEQMRGTASTTSNVSLPVR